MDIEPNNIAYIDGEFRRVSVSECKKAEPVLITSEWLELSGFKEHRISEYRFFTLSSVSGQIILTTSVRNKDDNCDFWTVETHYGEDVKYVHQLQNIVRLMFGYQLQINPMPHHYNDPDLCLENCFDMEYIYDIRNQSYVNFNEAVVITTRIIQKREVNIGERMWNDFTLRAVPEHKDTHNKIINGEKFLTNRTVIINNKVIKVNIIAKMIGEYFVKMRIIPLESEEIISNTHSYVWL